MGTVIWRENTNKKQGDNVEDVMKKGTYKDNAQTFNATDAIWEGTTRPSAILIWKGGRETEMQGSNIHKELDTFN